MLDVVTPCSVYIHILVYVTEVFNDFNCWNHGV